MDTDYMLIEKAKWELYKNTMTHTEQILEATSQKTADVQPPTSYLKDHLNKMKDMRETAREVRTNS